MGEWVWWLLGAAGWYLTLTYPKRPDIWQARFGSAVIVGAGVAMVAVAAYSIGYAAGHAQ